jgi:hypothetical protein
MHPADIRSVTIANNGTESGELRVDDAIMLVIDIPTLTSCNLEIQGKVDGSNWRDINSSGTQVAVWTSTTGNFIVDADVAARLVGIPAIRFVSSANQGAERTFTVRVLKG